MPRSIPIGPRSPLEHVERKPVCTWNANPYHGMVGYQDGLPVTQFDVEQFPQLMSDLLKAYIEWLHLAKALDEAGR